MHLFNDLKASLLHLAFPHVCSGCATDLLDQGHRLCLHCLEELPRTDFHLVSNNPVEKIFWGRLPLAHATAQYYFTRGSIIQHLLHQFKYRGDKDLGLYLGRLMGEQLAATNRFLHADAVVPLPLFPSRERKRGFNQAAVLCNGIGEVLQKPVWDNIVARVAATETQTKKSRTERWQNMKDRFILTNESLIQNKHLLLVDDVVTTGATLESCGTALLQEGKSRLSIATLCFSAG